MSRGYDTRTKGKCDVGFDSDRFFGAGRNFSARLTIRKRKKIHTERAHFFEVDCASARIESTAAYETEEGAEVFHFIGGGLRGLSYEPIRDALYADASVPLDTSMRDDTIRIENVLEDAHAEALEESFLRAETHAQVHAALLQIDGRRRNILCL